MKDPLGVSPSKGNQGTTRGKEKIILTSVGIEPTTSGLDLPLLCRLSYEVGQRKSEVVMPSAVCQQPVSSPSAARQQPVSSPSAACQQKSGGRGFDFHRDQKNFFFTSCGSLIPFTRANAQWVFHGLHKAL